MEYWSVGKFSGQANFSSRRGIHQEHRKRCGRDKSRPYMTIVRKSWLSRSLLHPLGEIAQHSRDFAHSLRDVARPLREIAQVLRYIF